MKEGSRGGGGEQGGGRRTRMKEGAERLKEWPRRGVSCFHFDYKCTEGSNATWETHSKCTQQKFGASGWWRMPLISAFRRQRQAITANFRPAWSTVSSRTGRLQRETPPPKKTLKKKCSVWIFVLF